MKKYNLSNIMKRAWEIKKENIKNMFSFCLKMAWAEARKIQVVFSRKEKEMNELKGSEKQVAWAKDIISGANDAIERFNLYKVKELFEENQSAEWFINNYYFASKRARQREGKSGDYDFYRKMLYKEWELRSVGMKKSAAYRLMDDFSEFYDEVEKDFVGILY